MSTNENAGKKRKLIWDIMMLLFITIFIAIAVCGFLMYRNSREILLQEKYDDSCMLARYIRGEFDKNTNIEWLMEYWVAHHDEMDVVYDSKEALDQRIQEFCEKYSVSYADNFDSLDISGLPDEAKRMYAEIEYMDYILLFDGIKQLYRPRYLYCETVIGDDEVMYLFNGRIDGEERGEDVTQIYMLGKTQKLSKQDFPGVYQTFETGVEQSQRYTSDTKEDDNKLSYHVYVPVVKNGKTLALICVNMDAQELHGKLRKELFSVELLAIGVLLLCAAVIANVLKLTVVSPIGRIQESVKKFGKDRDAQALKRDLETIRTKNEIGMLAEDMASLGIELVNHMNEITDMAAKQQKMNTELSLASRIQDGALSKEFDMFPSEWNTDLYALMDPARDVGGDFYSFMQLDDTHISLLIADVSGKGVPAALFMMICKVLLDNDVQYYKEPGRILEGVNRKICENNKADMFVTVWLGVLDIETGIMRTANAGHEYPIIRRADGSVEVVEDKHGLVMGGMAGVKYTEHEIKLNHGDLILQYTDGVTEANNKKQEMFGMDRLVESVKALDGSGAQNCIESVRRDIDIFIEGEEQFDDMTMIAFRY